MTVSLQSVQALLDEARADVEALIAAEAAPPAPAPAPAVKVGVGRWDVQSFPPDPANASLQAALKATTAPVGYFVVCGVAVASYTAVTPLEDFKTQEAQADVMIPMPQPVKHGSSYDQLLQVFGPTGDVWSIGKDAADSRSGFGATHVLAPDPVTGLYWGEPGPNSSSAGRIPFGWFTAEEVAAKSYKTLSFCAPNLAHVPARYPADPKAATAFPITVATVPTGIPLGSMWRLPKATVIPAGLTPVEDYIAHCALLHGEVCRDIGSTKGYYGIDYINTVGNTAGWKQVMPVDQLNGSLPYAHKLTSPAFLALMGTLECVAAVAP